MSSASSRDSRAAVMVAPGTEDTFQVPIPMRPRFLTELVVVQTEDGVAIDGTDRLQILLGAPWRNLLPELIALMDGTRTLDQLQRSLFKLPRDHVRDAVTSLNALGLVEEGNEFESNPSPPPQTLSFLRRYIGVTRSNRNGMEAYQKMQASEVLLVAPNANSGEIEFLGSLLGNSGIGHVPLIGRESLKTWRRATKVGQPIVLSLSFTSEDLQWHTELDEWCASQGIRWLRATIDQADMSGDLGPLFNGEYNPCYRCFVKTHHKSPFEPILFPGRLPTATASFWASMVAIEIIYLLSDIGPLVTGRNFLRLDLRKWTSQRLFWPRVPGCPRCRPLDLNGKERDHASPQNTDQMDTAILFEDYVGLQSHPGSRILTTLLENFQDNATLSFESKRLSNCARYVLSRDLPKLERDVLDILSTHSVPAKDSLTLEQLSKLLLITGGIRDRERQREMVRRWAATAGNLGSVELFVAVRDVQGLPPGFYFYQPYEHSLASLQRHSRATDVESFVRDVALHDPDVLPDALVLFTGAFHRVARKYGAFAYRLISLDAGAAVSQLRLVAGGLNIQNRVANRWAADLIEKELNLEHFQEQPTAVVALYGKNAWRAAESIPLASQPEFNTSNSTKDIRTFCELSLKHVVERLYDESRVDQRSFRSRTPLGFAPSLGTHSVQCSTVLPSPAGRGASLESILARRSSVRHYKPDAVSKLQLSIMLHCAHCGDKNDWPEEHSAGQALQYLVLAQRVDGLAQAVYMYKGSTNELYQLNESINLTRRENILELFVQPEFVSAPLFIWIAGDLATASERHSAFGHRLLLLRAGAAGHRLYFAALSVGLSGCLVAGLVQGAARRLLGLDGFRRASLFGFATGYGMEPAG